MALEVKSRNVEKLKKLYLKRTQLERKILLIEADMRATLYKCKGAEYSAWDTFVKEQA